MRPLFDVLILVSSVPWFSQYAASIMLHQNIRRIGLVLLLGSLLAGCGSSDRARLAPVEGMVTHNGQPLRNGTIIFESEGARPASGKIEDGRIVEVTTYEPNDGVPVGTHRVSIQSVISTAPAQTGASPAAATGDPAVMMASQSLIPARYGNPADSGLTATIEAGASNVLDFRLADEK